MLNTPVKTLHLGASPLAMVETATHLIIAGNNYTFFFFDPKSLTLVRSHRITNSFENLSPYHKGMQGAGELIHVPFSKKNVSALISSKKGLNKEAVLDWHGAQVDACAFSHDKMLVATGGANGRVFVHAYAGGRLITAFGRPESKVTALAFDNKGRYLAAAFADKSLIIFDLDLNVPLAVHETLLGGVAEAIYFLQDGKGLFAACRGGETVVVDLQSGLLVSREKRLEGWPSALSAGQDENHVLVATRQSRLYFLRPSDNAVIGELHLQKAGVSLLKLMGNHLFIGYTDGTLEIVAIVRELEAFTLALDLRRYDEARRIMLRQPFLMIHPIMKRFEEAWEETLKSAADQIAAKNNKKAQELVEPFLFDPRMAEAYEKLEAQKFLFGRLSDAIARKDYGSAYALAEKNPAVRKLTAFVDLENHWNRTCAKGRKLIEQDVAKNRKHIIHLLKPFEEIPSKKPIINGLIHQHKAYLEAKDALAKNDFERLFDLAEEYPFIAQMDFYQRLYPLIERILIDAEAMEKKGRYAEALELLEKIRTLAPFREKAHKQTVRLLHKQSFARLSDRQMICESYVMIERMDFLKETVEFDRLHRQFQEASEAAMEAAFAGQTRKVLDLMESWLSVNYLKHKIVSIVRISYLYELKNALKAKAPVCTRTSLKEYVMRFCKDPEILKIAEEFGLNDHLEGASECANPEGYLEHGLPDTILTKAQ